MRQVRQVRRAFIDPFPDSERKSAAGNSRILSALFLLQTLMYVLLAIHVSFISSANLKYMYACVGFSAVSYFVSRTRFYKTSVFAFIIFQACLIPICVITADPNTPGYNSTVMWLVTGPIAAGMVLTFRETLITMVIAASSYVFIFVWSQGALRLEMYVQIAFFFVVTGLLGLGKKLRERIGEELEREKIKSQQNARLASVGILAAGIAHELNTPLASIVTSAELIDVNLNHQPVQVDEIGMNNQRILEVAFGMSEIIKSLKSYASSEPLRSTHVLPLSDLINTVETTLSERVQDSKSMLKIGRHYGDINCRVDHKVMVQAISNLIQNGFEAQSQESSGADFSSDSRVEMVVTLRNDQVSIQIIDNGKGIDDTLAPRIFDPFVTTKPFGKGPGLGLSIAKTIIEKHDGRLELARRRHPTIFEITLPIAKAS